MRKLIAIALLALPGCANLSGDWDNWVESQRNAARTLQSMFQADTEHPSEGEEKTDAEVKQQLEEMETRWADEERRKKEAEEARGRAQAELEKRREAEEARRQARIAGAEASGYIFVSFSDFYLDYKTLPRGSRRAVTGGLYQVFGEFETLTQMPSNSPWDGTPRVPLITESAPRDVRERLLAPKCRVAFCEGVFLGSTVECTITRWGHARSGVCFAIDGMW